MGVIKLPRAHRPIKRARAMVPNFFTVGNMALGFYAIIAAINGRWVAAPTAIFMAHILDILDGRIARWMGLSSDFGKEFDSFADLISFGLAPAIMIYLLVLHEYGKLGVMLAFFFVLCGAFRLARFNLNGTSTPDSPFINPNFSGLPIPGAGGFIAVLVLLVGLSQNDIQGKTLDIIYNSVPQIRQMIPLIVFGLSWLMISKVQYNTFKRVHLFRPQSLRPFLMVLFVGFMIYAYPQNTIFILYVTYILGGAIATLWRANRLRFSGRSQDRFEMRNYDDENQHEKTDHI